MANAPVNNASSNPLIPRAVMNAVFKANKLNICHINVQSLCARKLAKFEELKMNFINSKTDIICMSETWLNNTISDAMINIEGYDLVRNDRNRHGGGVCVYFKKEIACRVLRKSEFAEFVSGQGVEHLLLDFKCSEEHILLGVYYNPPETDCSETLFNHLEEYKVKYKSMFMIGDFNTDLCKNSRRSSRFSDVLKNMSSVCVNREPTYFYPTGCSLLDLFITDTPDKVLKFHQVSMPGVSKHDIIFSTLDFATQTEPAGF